MYQSNRNTVGVSEYESVADEGMDKNMTTMAQAIQSITQTLNAAKRMGAATKITGGLVSTLKNPKG